MLDQQRLSSQGQHVVCINILLNCCILDGVRVCSERPYFLSQAEVMTCILGKVCCRLYILLLNSKHCIVELSISWVVLVWHFPHSIDLAPIEAFFSTTSDRFVSYSPSTLDISLSTKYSTTSYRLISPDIHRSRDWWASSTTVSIGIFDRDVTSARQPAEKQW